MSYKRIKFLIEKLNEASFQYYVKNNSNMSDFEYDKLYDELVSLENETGLIFAQSPTQKVGYEVLSDLKKIKHNTKVLSLDKTKEPSKLQSFLGEQEGVLSLKLDGLTIVLIYENGQLKTAITRGNGKVGEDVTHNAKVFKNIPKKISFKGNLTIRGEAVISYSDFAIINETLEEKYKNPRNLASGTVRQLNSEIAAKRKVMFFAFELVNSDVLDNLKSNRLQWLCELGFDVVDIKIVNKETVCQCVEQFKEEVIKSNFGSDGLVLTYNDISYSNSLGVTQKFPKDSIAFKWEDETTETTLIDVLWNTSRTGLVNPIAVFEPVEIEGSVVNRASVHNVSIFEKLCLGKGDIIKVYKANMIIPQIAENLTKSNTLKVPCECTVCKEKVEIISKNEVKMLFCINKNCKAQLIKSVSHYVSLDAMNIEGLSEATIEKFVENGFIENYTDIYFLERYEKEIKALPGFGDLSYNNLVAAIEKSKNVSLPSFIYALGINNVGIKNAKLMCSHFNYSLNSIVNATSEQLETINGFGEVIAESIVSYFNQQKNIELMNVALRQIKIIDESNNNNNIDENSKKDLSGITFVITGSLSIFKNRTELKKQIEKLGGNVASSVSSKTTYLINNDINSNSSKNKKAQQLGVKIINEQQLLELSANLKD